MRFPADEPLGASSFGTESFKNFPDCISFAEDPGACGSMKPESMFVHGRRKRFPQADTIHALAKSAKLESSSAGTVRVSRRRNRPND